GFYDHLLGNRTHLQTNISVIDRVRRDSQIGLRQRLKPACRNLKVILTRRKLRNCVVAALIGVCFAHKTRATVSNGHVCLRYGRAALISYDTRDRAVQHLRLRRRHGQRDMNYHQRKDRKPTPSGSNATQPKHFPSSQTPGSGPSAGKNGLVKQKPAPFMWSRAPGACFWTKLSSPKARDMQNRLKTPLATKRPNAN